MATIEGALDTALKASSPVTTVFGQRIYWMNAPEVSTLPYLVYRNIIDTDEVYAFGLPNTGRARIQFDAVSTTKAGKAGLYAVRTLLRHQSGTIGGATIYDIKPAGLREVYNGDTLRYVFTAEYEIAFNY